MKYITKATDSDDAQLGRTPTKEAATDAGPVVPVENVDQLTDSSEGDATQRADEVEEKWRAENRVDLDPILDQLSELGLQVLEGNEAARAQFDQLKVQLADVDEDALEDEEWDRLDQILRLQRLLDAPPEVPGEAPVEEIPGASEAPPEAEEPPLDLMKAYTFKPTTKRRTFQRDDNGFVVGWTETEE